MIKADITKSTQKVIEILEKHCFEVKQKGSVYICNRPNCEQIRFIEGFSGANHLFQVSGKPCFTVNEALKLAGARL